MTKRGCAVVGVGLALVAVCGLSALVLYGSYGALRETGARLSILSAADTPATVRDMKTYRVGATPRLVVDTEAGGITVTVGSAGVIEVETVRTARAADAAAARAAAAALAVTARQEGDTVTLTYEAPDERGVRGGRPGIDMVGFNIQVPPATAVALSTGVGAVHLAGTAGEATLRSSFGEVTAEDLTGALAAESSAGAVTLRRLRTDGAVSARSDFGAVTLADVAGRTVTARSSNGAVNAEDITATGRLHVSSDFGPVTVRRARAGDFDLGSANGAVTVEAPALTGSGRLGVHSDFGPVRVTGARDAVLALASENGAVRFDGRLAAGRPHSARSSFGDVVVAIPADSRLDVILSTDFGQAASDLPLTVQGTLDDQKITGTLNGGGPTLELRSSNGDVRLEPLDGAN